MTYRAPVPASPAFEAIARGARFRDRIAIVVNSRRPFMTTLLEGGTLVLHDDPPHEVITGSAARLHRVHQAPQRFASREAFEAFGNPGHEKLFMSVRVAPTGRPGEHWLVLEHATRALSPAAARQFARYWRVVKPMGACVTWLDALHATYGPGWCRWAPAAAAAGTATTGSTTAGSRAPRASCGNCSIRPSGRFSPRCPARRTDSPCWRSNLRVVV